MSVNTRYPGPENIFREQLDNGIVLLVYENFAAPSVELEGVCRAGSLADPADRLGLAQFVSGMLMRGADGRSFEDIYEELESVGASLQFSAGRHTNSFSGSALAEDLSLLLGLTADALRRPSFPIDHVEKVRGEHLTGLQIMANDTRHMAGRAFRNLLYGEHPYAAPTEGEPETVSAIMRDDLVAFHDEYYGPAGMIVTIVGAVKAEDALEMVRQALGDWNKPQQPMPQVATVDPPPEIRRVQVAMPGKTQSDIVLGLPGPPRAAPDYQQLRVANTILGVFGMYGRLGKTVREEQGLAYYVYSRLSGGLGPSPWYVGTGVSPDKVAQAVESIRSEIRRIQDELVPSEELDDTQAYLTGSLPVSLETNDGLSSIITNMELYSLGLDYLQHYPDEIRSITPQIVQQMSRKYLSADNIAVAVAGPEFDGQG